MSRNELPESGRWDAVERAIHREMKRLDMSLARLSRESGVSETTIRYIEKPRKRQRSTLVALSAALGCRHDYLVDVLNDAPGLEGPSRSTADTVFEDLLQAEVGPLKEKVNAIDGKVDILLDRLPEE